jgi:hypothetical protein
MDKSDSLRLYCDSHPPARQWAAGSFGVRHNEETVSRVFRMGEQLRANFEWHNVDRFFSLLAALDGVVDAETWPCPRPNPRSASAAALAGFKILFANPVVQDHDLPYGF